MLIFALDPGPEKSGWCIYETRGKTPLMWGHNDWAYIRYLLKQTINDRINKGCKTPLKVEYEEIFFYTGPGNRKVLPPAIENMGRIKQICDDYSIDYQGISRMEVIRTIMGEQPTKGKKFSKSQVRDKVYHIISYKPKDVTPLHAADALAVAVALHMPQKKSRNESSTKKKTGKRRKKSA